MNGNRSGGTRPLKKMEQREQERDSLKKLVSAETPRKRDDMGEMMVYLQKVERIAQDVSADGES